jgi:hypothetical protein
MLASAACSHPRADELGAAIDAYDDATPKVGWPGFDPATVPLAIYDTERTYLIRYPDRPAIFAKMRGVEGAFVADTLLDELNANTDLEFGGHRIAVIGADWDRDPVELAAVMVHEAFHAYQSETHPGWTANEVDLFTYPIRSLPLLDLRRLEGGALRRAIVAGDSIRELCWAQAFLRARGERFARLPDAARRYEQGTELREGLARYLQSKAEGGEPSVPADGFPPEDVRERAYATGHAIAVLLDRLAPGWQRALSESDSIVALESVLGGAIGELSVRRCGPSPDERARSSSLARTDLADLERRDARARAAFEGARGWSVELAAGSEPLQVEQFDPLNVRVLDQRHVLHTRWVAVSVGETRAEARGRTAMTRGLTGHPLFAGVDRFRVTGIPEPEIVQAGDTIRITGEGLTLTSVGASLERDGQEIRVVANQ